MNIGYGIRAIREERGISRSDLERRANLPQGYVSRVEGERRLRPSADKLVRIARELGVTVEELFGTVEGRAA